MAIAPAAARINELLSIYTLASTPLGEFAETSAVSWGTDGTLAHKLEAGALTASLTATGALNIDVLNDKDDKDRENIVGKAAKDAREGIDWAPQIEPDGKARLAYHINLALKAGLTGKLAAAGKFSLSAERAFILSAYRVHAAQQTFFDAVRADLVAPEFAPSRNVTGGLSARSAGAGRFHRWIESSLSHAHGLRHVVST